MTHSLQTAPRPQRTAPRNATRLPLVRLPSVNAPRVERETAASSRARTSSIDVGWEGAQRDKQPEPNRDSLSSFSRFTPTLPSAFSRSSTMETLPGIGPMLAPVSRAHTAKELRRSIPGHVTLFDVDVPQHLPALPSDRFGQHGARVRQWLPVALVALVGFAVGFGVNFGLTRTRAPASAAAVVPEVQSAVVVETAAVVAPAPAPEETPSTAGPTPTTSEAKAPTAGSAVSARAPSGVAHARRRPALHNSGSSDNPY
jgi:hypothetical protein